MKPLRALLIGNSDGIGLETTRRLLAGGWAVTGVSRSASPVSHEAYSHVVHDVTAVDYVQVLSGLVGSRGPFDACIYCAGIGAWFDPVHVDDDVRVFEVNLLGAVRTAQAIVPAMLAAGSGHIVVLSSQADELVSTEAPSYAASKAALSSYVEGMGLALRRRGIYVTNMRFGFVDTKMAKASRRPFLLTAGQAADAILDALESRPLRVTTPLRMAVLLRIARWLLTWRIRIA